MGKLEDFLKDSGYDEIKDTIKEKLSVTDIEGGLVTYKCAGDLSKVISGILKANPKLSEKFTRNNDAEQEYLKKLEAAKTEAAKVITDAKTVRNFDKIKSVFDGLFSMKSPLEVLIVKQYEQRLKIRIEKYPFPKDAQDLICAGLFLVSVVHYMAKKDKAAAKAAESASEGKTITAEKDEITPKKQPMDEVLNNPRFISKYFTYVGEQGKKLWGFTREKLSQNPELQAFVSCYVDSIEAPTYEELDGGCGTDRDELMEFELNRFTKWLNEHADAIQGLPQFRKEVQEDPHEVLITEDNINGKYDPFVQFILGRDYYAEMLLYPYFFKGSEKKELSVYGKKFEKIVSYTYPKGVNVFENPKISDLDKLLKPIYFRDVTDEQKSYKKMSMDKLHSLVQAYISLLGKIIKYVRITYQCEKDKILVSFTTNNFDLPPQVDSEADFKNRYKANPGRVLYRGMSDAKQFEDMKKRGISSNARHHHDQYYGPGLYWTKEFKQAKDSFAREVGAVVSMAVACEDFPTIMEEFVNNQQYTEMSLMRNNQCLFIRPTAMCDARRLTVEDIKNLKKSPEYKNVVFCSTDEEIKKWSEGR